MQIVGHGIDGAAQLGHARVVGQAGAGVQIARAQLARHPLLLDELLDPNTLYQPTATDAYRDELRQYLLRVPEEDEEQQLEALRQWDKEKITACIQFVCEGLGLKLRDLMPLIFPAITGKASSVSVLDAMEILGADLSRFRLRQAVELLGGVSNGESKEWKKLLESFR